MSETIYIDPVLLTMQERLTQLRTEKKLRMEDVAKEIGISTATLSRFEKFPDMHIPYQNLVDLAEFFDVSMDYMCGLTLHRKYREMPIDKLNLTDGSVEFLKNNRNVRILNELLSSKIFPDLLAAAEVFADGKTTTSATDMNNMYSLVETTIKSRVDVDPQDEMLAILKESQVNNDEYLRFRITDRFNNLLNSIYDERKRYAEENTITVTELMQQNMDTLLNDKKAKEKGPFYCVAKTLGLNFEDVPKDKLEVFEEVLTGSDLYKLMVGQTTSSMPRKQRREMERQAKKRK